MKKLVSTLLFAIIGISLSAAVVTKARIDISGKMTLKPGKASAKCFVKNIGWGKKEHRKLCLTSESGALSTDKWTEVSFSFTPEADGMVSIILLASLSNDRRYINWVLYDKITAKGTEIINGDFGKSKNGKPLGWVCNSNNYISTDGNAMVKVWHNLGCRLSNIKVKKGQEVTITYFAKADKLEEVKK